ncbi:MAG: HD domain-containing protein [Thermotogae bacterium]|nr:HD domain-containing protein [Thermotogota bacterium]
MTETGPSIRKRSNVLLFLNILLVVLMLIITSLFFYNFLKLRSVHALYTLPRQRLAETAEMLLRAAINYRNYKETGETHYLQEYLALTQNIVTNLEELKSQLPESPTIKKIPEIIEALKNPTDETFKEMSARLHKILDDLITELQSRLDKIETVGVMLLITLVIGMASLLVTFSFSRRFVGRYRWLLKQISDYALKVIRNEPRLFPPAIWEEEREALKTLKIVEDNFAFMRVLLELPAFGTLEDVMPKLFELVKMVIPCQRISLAFIDAFGNVIEEATVSDFPVKLDTGFSCEIESTSLKKLVEVPKVRIINDLERYYRHVRKSRATELILNEGMKSSLTAPIVINEKTVGFLFINSTHSNVYTLEHSKLLEMLVNTIKSNIFYSYMVQQLVATTAYTLADIVEERDYETGKHLFRVAHYSYVITKKLAETGLYPEITPKYMREILWFSPLHDVGKVGIPDAVLLKPGKLTEEEYEEMKKHVTIGEEILRQTQQELRRKVQMDFLEMAIEIVASHHERWDGRGYPRGLKGEEIPLSGRIVAVADTFDALTSHRPYKPAYDFDRSIEIVKSESGKQFDPRIVEVFLNSMDEIRRIFEESGENGAK